MWPCRCAAPCDAAAERREAALAALESVGLAGFAGRYPWQLSGGMQQRVAIARALACDPVLLLMDEPFGSMDAQIREDLEDLVLRVRADRNIMILLVTHDIDESVYTGDRVIVLTAGPGRVRADVPVDLPAPRDQITTKELREFARLRAEVSRLVRGVGRPSRADVVAVQVSADAQMSKVSTMTSSRSTTPNTSAACSARRGCSTLVRRTRKASCASAAPRRRGPGRSRNTSASRRTPASRSSPTARRAATPGGPAYSSRRRAWSRLRAR